ncbi:MAG: peptide MFS transporter [Coprobacter sp.]|nr:peptide MFS transporter [Coprobacter sp.]
MSSTTTKHPKGLYLLFFTEMWERFSYYGMRAMLILYLTKTALEGGLGFSDSRASLIYGFFTGFVYFTPLIGGWLADNFIGQRRSITLGGLIMVVGQFFLAAKADPLFLTVGLVLLVVGNGFFKPNIAVLVGDLYPLNDSRRDSAFTIFYMGVNVGALIAPLVTGFLAMRYGYRWGFFASGTGILLGQLLYNTLSNRLLGEIGKTPAVSQTVNGKTEKKPLTKEEKDRTTIIFVLVAFCTFFWAGFEQAGTSMSLYTENFIDRTVGGFTIPTEWFQSVNPAFIILLAPLFSLFWNFLACRGKEPSIPVKMGCGMILLGLGFVLMTGAALQRDAAACDAAKASLLWLVGAYLLHTMGELCLSPIGLSMVSKLSPVRLASFMMGVWFLSSFAANIAGGVIASFFSKLGAMSIFMTIAAVSVCLGILLLLLRKWILAKMHGIK